MAYKVGPKGQVVLAKDIRDRFGIKPGWIALERVVGDHVEIQFLPPEHDRSLAGSLAKYARGKSVPQGGWRRIVEKAWGIGAREEEAPFHKSKRP